MDNSLNNAVESQSTEPGATPDLPVVPGSTTGPAASVVDTPHQASLIDTIDPAGSIEDTPTPKRRGRPRKDGTPNAQPRLDSVTRAPPRPVAPTGPPAATSIPTDPLLLGKIAGNLWFNVGVLFFGDGWAPEPGSGEPEMVSFAFRDYFVAEGITKISPSFQLGIVLGSYALARLQKPTVKSRIATGIAWFTQKFKRS